MPSKEFLCKKCGDMHKRPINSKCQFVDAHVSSESEIEKSPIASGGPGLSDNNDLNLQILAELKSLGGRMTAMEQKMFDTNSTEVSQRSPATAVSPAADSLAQMDQVVVPSVAALQGAPHIQAEVDRRIKHLTDLNESGKLKSQRGGNDTVFVKRQVPWPQNFVLGGNNKSRISYDNLSWCQWVLGFAMLDYLSEIMEDANDFSWQSAKASHAVLLCRMEEGKVEWSETTKIDRIRRAHAQRLPPQNNITDTKSKSETKTAVCRFYQRAMYQHRKDHETGGTFYKHVCATCFTMGKEYKHMAGVSKTSKKRLGHRQQAVQRSVNNCVTVKKSGKTRIVYSKDLKNGCSYNWRADWATFVGKTYAQVVKAKNDLQGQTLTQPKQAVGKRRFKPTVLANNYNIAPDSCPVVKNVENIKHVKCKKVTKTTGVKTLLKHLNHVTCFIVKPKIDLNSWPLLLRLQTIVLILSWTISQEVHKAESM